MQRSSSVTSRHILVAALAIALMALGAPGAPAEAAPFPWDHDVAVDLLRLPTSHSPAPYVVDWDGDGADDLLVGLRGADQHGGIAVHLRRPDGLGQRWPGCADTPPPCVVRTIRRRRG
jgi:hypothetical protein